MDTFPSLFSQQTNTRSSEPAIRYKRYGLWRTWTWSDVQNIVQEFACGLAAKGLKPGEYVVIFGNNIPEIYFSMLSAHLLGLVPVPVHPDSNQEELVTFLNDCQARFVIVQDQQHVDACYEIKEQCSSFEEMIYCDGRGMQEYQSSRLHIFSDIREMGKKFTQDHPNFLNDISNNVAQDNEAFIIYTPGTSGDAKGVVHTYSSLINVAKAFAESENISSQEEVLAFLPISYAASALFSYTLWLLKGYTINCPESNETIMMDLREIGPTVLYAPPHFYKQLYSEITARAQRSNTKSFDKWFNYAHQARESLMNGNASGGGLKDFMANLLMFAPLKNVYGLTKLRHAYTGGDNISNEIFNFFRSIGVNLKKCYGTTESAGLISVQGDSEVDSHLGEHNMGVPLSGVEVKILDNGEIAFKGNNSFKEYHRDPELTASVKSADGWIKTGDAGAVEANGGIRVTDRMDSVGQFSSGSQFAPHLVESALKSSPFIKEAVALGNNKENIAAFIVIDEGAVGSWAEVNDIRFTGYRDLATKDEVYDLVKKTVVDVNSHMEQIEGKDSPPIRRFLIMHREFNVDAGELTRSKKIRRDVVMGKHQALVDALYSTQSNYEIKDQATGETLAELKLESA